MTILPLAGLLLASLPGQARTEPTPPAQYLLLNRAPGRAWDPNRPESVSDETFTEPMRAVGAAGSERRKLGLTFVISYLNGPPERIQATLNRLLEMSEKHRVPVVIALDGQNWWNHRPDLWNWWDPRHPGFDPRNARNVEWYGPSPSCALKLAWRNWGRQIRVVPPPNLASPAFRAASREAMRPLLATLAKWRRGLSPDRRHLFVGLKVGWETSVGINAYYYPAGNALIHRDPTKDPQRGLRMEEGLAGGLAPLGYAARASMAPSRQGPITRRDHEEIASAYLRFLTKECRVAGFARGEVFTHAGGQYAPWDMHVSHRVAITPDALPGWSFYGVGPSHAGDLAESLQRAGLEEWCAAEWLPTSAKTAVDWAKALEDTLGYKRCRFLCLYNWESIAQNEEALSGIRTWLSGPANVMR